jgi:hypothetical protein
MELFRGKAHIPGTEREGVISIELDWNGKQCIVHTEGSGGHVTAWPGLVVQTFDVYEIAFKTKGIPKLGTHWWHLVRDKDNLSGLIVGLPDAKGVWTTCGVSLDKVEMA